MQQIHFHFDRNNQPDQLTIIVPDSWDQCNEKLFPVLAELFIIDDEVMSRAKKGVAALIAVAGDAWEVLEQMDDEQIYNLLPAVDWVFEQADINRNILKELLIEAVELYGPDDELKNMRFAEWCVADTLYVDYAKSQDPRLLNRLIAVLYRRKGKGSYHRRGHPNYCGDIRHRFNDAILDDEERLVAKLPRSQKRAIYLWYASCRQKIITRYTEMFNSGGEKSNPRLAADGWFGIYDDLRGDPRFGGPDKLEQEFIHTVFASVCRSQVKVEQFKMENGL